MESNITIKASVEEMSDFFDENSVCSVRHYEQNKDGTFQARIRYAERKRRLSGTFTIPQIIKRLGGK